MRLLAAINISIAIIEDGNITYNDFNTHVRGIAIYDNKIFVAHEIQNSSYYEILVLDFNFKLIETLSLPYKLGEVHDLAIHNNVLWIMCTSHDKITT